MLIQLYCLALFFPPALQDSHENKSSSSDSPKSVELVEVADLAWMSGSWVSDSSGRRSEEHWTKPAGNTLLGVSRTIAGERTVFFEFLRIEKTDKGIVYYAAPKGRHPPTPFALIESADRRVVFENPEHDFPQRIIYWMDGEVLHARIEGMRDGKLQGSQWSWKRMPKDAE